MPKFESTAITLAAKEEMMPHIEALIEVIKIGAKQRADDGPNPHVGANQFAYGGIAIQLLVDTLLRACPEMSEGKERKLFDENYATAVKFGTMLFFAQRDASL